MPFDWNEQQKADLRQWWLLDGLSAAQISKKLTEKYGEAVTRNAVIGKATRLGISGDNRIGQPASAAYRAGGRMNARRREEAKPARVPPAPKPRPAHLRADLAPAVVAAAASSTAPTNLVPVAPTPEPPPELVIVGQAVVMSDIGRDENGFLVERGLRAACCKYPVGPTPPAGEMHRQLFCAAATGDAIRPYCDKHERIAWKPSNPGSTARVIKNAVNAAHRDMQDNNRRRGSNASRAVF